MPRGATGRIQGPLCEGWPVHDLIVEPSSGAILAGAGNPWYGPAIWRSDDRGSTWTHSSAGLTYGDEAEPIKTVWSLSATPDGALLAGVEPAGLFRSEDGGSTWRHIEGLTNHPTRPTWGPGAGGLILHTIIPHPTDTDRTWVGISAVGVFETRDGGTSWEPRNVGVRAEFNPENRFPETGQCVHKFAIAAGQPETLYQRNHCGVYRSDDGSATWQEITDGPADRLRLRDGQSPARPRLVLAHPAQHPRGGSLHARWSYRGLADARPGRDVDLLGCRAADARRVHVGPSRGDGARHARPGRDHVRDRDRAALAQLR